MAHQRIVCSRPIDLERREMKARIRIIVAVLLGALTLGATVAAAAPPKVTPGSRWLALGDSVTFGYMEPSVVPAPNYRNPKSFLGYPEQLAAQMRLNVSNPACPGETSASLINDKAPSNGCENEYRKNFPLHVRYKGSQLAYGLSYLRANRNTRLVSLMIGANDLFLCQKTTPDGCTGRGEFAAALAKIGHNVHTILSAIRNKAHYSGQLVIVNYYSLNYSIPLINTETLALNSTVDLAAKPFKVKIADGFGLLRLASSHSGANTCTAGLLTQLSTGGCGVHPSYAGQALLAQAVAKVLQL
jgi:lysophospholipase L1-like esterase